eukprot:s364_g9.t1
MNAFIKNDLVSEYTEVSKNVAVSEYNMGAASMEEDTRVRPKREGAESGVGCGGPGGEANRSDPALEFGTSGVGCGGPRGEANRSDPALAESEPPQLPIHARLRVEVTRRPQRGLTQKLKKGVTAGILAMALVQAAGENVKKLKEVVREQKPDVLVITPPCGPWSLWQNQQMDFEKLASLRDEHIPFWQLTRDLWEIQDSEGRWVVTEQPSTSEALELSYMTERPNLHRVVLDQCMFGLKDPVSGKGYRKTTALDVNDEAWAQELAKARRCDHLPEEHEQVKGNVKYDGKWHRRSTLAGGWTRRWCDHILRAFEKSQEPGREIPTKLHQGSKCKPVFDINAVEGVVTPEEVLRQQLQAVGAEGENFDFIHFEGEARALPRRVRRMLAHLHVTLGHLSNERLARMLSLAGGGKGVLLGAKHLRCQVCSMVRPPQSRPQASYQKPSNFNEKISGDCFHVWDIKGLRYTALHFIDELTDYQVGDLTFDPNSGWVSRVLRDKWYGVFGPPDALVSDGGLEFQGAMVRLNEMCGVVHEVVPDQAKWRLGHCERHGAVLKIIIMKTVTALRIETLEEMQWAMVYALSAKNRLATHGGVSPLQAVTGRNSPLPSSLLNQLTSGEIKFKMNEELQRNEALRRSESSRPRWTSKGIGITVKASSLGMFARRHHCVCLRPPS